MVVRASMVGDVFTQARLNGIKKKVKNLSRKMEKSYQAMLSFTFLSRSSKICGTLKLSTEPELSTWVAKQLTLVCLRQWSSLTTSKVSLWVMTMTMISGVITMVSSSIMEERQVLVAMDHSCSTEVLEFFNLTPQAMMSRWNHGSEKKMERLKIPNGSSQSS